MNKIPIIDGHLDLAWNSIALNRCFEDSVEIKHEKEPISITDVEGVASVGFPEIKAANIRVLFSTIWVETSKSINPSLGSKYCNINEARCQAEEQYNYYISLCKNNGYKLIRTKIELENILDSDKYCLGLIPLIEGVDFVNSLDDMNLWLEKGIKLIAPIWQKNQFGGCSELGGGLTPKGVNLVKFLSKKNVIIDIAHMSDEAVDDVFKNYDGMVINSHTACRAYINEKRLICDNQIKMIRDRNGVIGLMTWKQKLNSGTNITLNDYIDHICHILSITGNVDNIAIGSSMDGGYGVESLPKEMNSIQSLELLKDAMQKRGFSYQEIEKIMYKNWERILMQVLC